MGLEVKQKDLRHPKFESMEDAPLREAIRKPTDERLWALAEGLRRGWTADEVNRISRVDKWFLRKIQSLLKVELKLKDVRGKENPEVGDVIQEAFLLGFPSPTIASILEIDPHISREVGKNIERTRQRRQRQTAATGDT